MLVGFLAATFDDQVQIIRRLNKRTKLTVAGGSVLSLKYSQFHPWKINFPRKRVTPKCGGNMEKQRQNYFYNTFK